MSVRVYLPTTRAGLAALVGGDDDWRAVAGAEPVVAEGDSEDEEYAALMTAADASTALYETLGEAGRRRVVVVAEVASPDAPVGLGDVASVHLDTDDRAANADPDDDLAWFVPEELQHLL
ncbi:DUF6912 family protein [Nocardioides daphniae]|uniref:Uncharacterized protein n=1 Tax=Nocardioides daphniae TaxID=402297 RepID=A0A4P7U9D1_9ACTN|nr:hypothetical protein [Nocardioides daphniae]QCC76692.1 hypothetical protein E2C04_04700 [Nocardioides daphniae]GGD15393.1 hypothetical protein GCM10007231_12990 [Nocardioides daphniae]